MLHWKRVLVPTKLTKVLCLLAMVVSATVFYIHRTTKSPKLVEYEDNKVKPMLKMKYILHWNDPTSISREDGDGSLLFLIKKCEYNNCYLTDRSSMLPDITEFDVILFDSQDIQYFENSFKFPRKKAPSQKYIFVSWEASLMFPACDAIWNRFFHWAWTYKLDSDLVWRYFVIKNKKGEIIGPKRNMHWPKVEHMKPVDSKLVMKLQSKTRVAAWFASTCKTNSHREEFVTEVNNYLSKYKMKVDIYGSCGELVCPKLSMDLCLNSLSKNYFFYFAFESAMSDDYVTDIVLHALQHDTVPVVFGAANYSRFLPDGSYLNALLHGPEKLARRMVEIMQNRSIYQTFFRWRNHYSYHAHDESPETDNYCRLCALINDKDMFHNATVKRNFKSWWNLEGSCTLPQPTLPTF